MAEIAIPGVSDKYGTTKLIEDLMKVERVPLERAKTYYFYLRLHDASPV